MSDKTDPPQVSDIEAQKLAFEREKYLIEETWKRKTFLWSVVSTLIGSAVSVGIAMISMTAKGAPPKALSPRLTAATVENCRLSLQRLPTLAMQENQTVTNLREAVGRHVADCDQVLVDMATFLAGSDR
ncbi:MAG TPA: hypothetical protein VH988_05010 [Thermoanaerobaculia bacterium]|nr:hypothetical protein [Thermoanaerobaculia bacterium]